MDPKTKQALRDAHIVMGGIFLVVAIVVGAFLGAYALFGDWGIVGVVAVTVYLVGLLVAVDE